MYICVLFIYMYVCMFMCTHICVYTYMYIYICVYMNTWINIHIYMNIFLYICIYIHIPVYIYIYVYIYVYVYIHIQKWLSLYSLLRENTHTDVVWMCCSVLQRVAAFRIVWSNMFQCVAVKTSKNTRIAALFLKLTLSQPSPSFTMSLIPPSQCHSYAHIKKRLTNGWRHTHTHTHTNMYI